jgi:hypothetical protein
MAPTTYSLPGGKAVVIDNLTQHYVAREPHLEMAIAELDVKIQGMRVYGSWPDYHIDLLDPQGEISVAMDYHGRRVAWWSDIPGIYTHLATFGEFAVTMQYVRGTRIRDVYLPVENPETLQFRARGALEHVFARKVSGFNRLYLPVRLLGRWFPGLKPLLYQYEVLMGEGLEGGFVRARAFGLDFRNRGALFAGEQYHEVRRVKVKHLAADPVDNCGGDGALTQAWRIWEVEAVTDAGTLLYRAERTHPPAMSGASTNQYHFAFEGSWRGAPVTGRGYGEFANL